MIDLVLQFQTLALQIWPGFVYASSSKAKPLENSWSENRSENRLGISRVPSTIDSIELKPYWKSFAQCDKWFIGINHKKTNFAFLFDLSSCNFWLHVCMSVAKSNIKQLCHVSLPLPLNLNYHLVKILFRLKRENIMSSKISKKL